MFVPFTKRVESKRTFLLKHSLNPISSPGIRFNEKVKGNSLSTHLVNMLWLALLQLIDFSAERSAV